MKIFNLSDRQKMFVMFALIAVILIGFAGCTKSKRRNMNISIPGVYSRYKTEIDMDRSKIAHYPAARRTPAPYSR